MKRSILIIFALIITSSIRGGDNPPLPKDPSDGSNIPPIVKPGGRTNVEESNVKAYYDGATIYIWFTEPEGQATITLSDNTGEVFYSASHPTTMPIVIIVNSQNDPFLVYIVSQEGHEYEGWIE
ncbi:MAG: hypothetical protein K2M06_00065 [Muribaculaceae bacterium]|nr:hypothetical protein [Muribaculaceae bacterium]